MKRKKRDWDCCLRWLSNQRPSLNAAEEVELAKMCGLLAAEPGLRLVFSRRWAGSEFAAPGDSLGKTRLLALADFGRKSEDDAARLPGEVRVNLRTGQIWVNGTEKRLTRTEAEFLRILRRWEGNPVPRQVLARAVEPEPAVCGIWFEPKYHIRNLRRKLEQSHDRPVIENRRGWGYILRPGVVRFLD